MEQLLQQKKEHQRLKVLADEVKQKALETGVSRALIDQVQQENI